MDGDNVTLESQSGGATALGYCYFLHNTGTIIAEALCSRNLCLLEQELT